MFNGIVGFNFNFIDLRLMWQYDEPLNKGKPVYSDKRGDISSREETTHGALALASRNPENPYGRGVVILTIKSFANGSGFPAELMGKAKPKEVSVFFSLCSH